MSKLFPKLYDFTMYIFCKINASVSLPDSYICCNSLTDLLKKKKVGYAYKGGERINRFNEPLLRLFLCHLMSSKAVGFTNIHTGRDGVIMTA